MRLRALTLLVYQRIALPVAHAWYRLTLHGDRKRDISWVVGPDENSSTVAQIASAVPRSFSVSYENAHAYSHRYDYSPTAPRDSRRWEAARVLGAPWHLARLMCEAEGFIYVGPNGFLTTGDDHREYEFRYLKKHGLRIVCWWLGSDIRSTAKMHELERQTGLPNISTYIGIRSPVIDTPEWEERKRGLAAVGDRYADAMFSNSVDHLGYLETPTEPFLYFLSEEQFGNTAKFESVTTPVLVHATTSPAIKGTPLVRAAIAKLRHEGYDFEYVELSGVPNDVVRAALARAHIVLNQFYGFSTAVFGAEGLAAAAVVMMSADEHIETDFAPGSNSAWVVTKHFQVYDNLKMLLDNRSSWAAIAERGVAWAREYASAEVTGNRLRAILDRVLEGTYEPPGPRP